MTLILLIIGCSRSQPVTMQAAEKSVPKVEDAEQIPASVNPDHSQFRKAAFPEERFIVKAMRDRLGPDFVVVEDKWGPHILDRIVYPPAGRMPFDVVLKLDEFDERKPAKYLRFAGHSINKTTASEAGFDLLYVLQSGKVIIERPWSPGKKQDRITGEIDWLENPNTWTAPYMKVRRESHNAR